MIKEQIESMPGGKQYLQAQRGYNMAIGLGVGFLLSIPTVIIAMLKAESVGEEIGLSVFAVSFILSIMCFMIGFVGYYHAIYKADNIYMTEIKKQTE